jgi:hypothetical protein
MTDFEIARDCYVSTFPGGETDFEVEFINTIVSTLDKVTPYNVYQLLDKWGFVTPDDWSEILYW